MRFLNTIKKAKQVEADNNRTIAAEPVTAETDNGRRTTAQPFGDSGEFKIGKPVIQIANGKPHSPVVETQHLQSPTSTSTTSSPVFVGHGGNSDSLTFAKYEIVPSAVNKRLVPISDPNSPFCEDYRGLRTQIIHGHDKKDMKSVVIMSHGQAEGKTVTAINVAWLLAQTDGIKALLIDGDMRLPSVADYLGFESKRGLSDLLAGDAELQDVVLTLEPSGLHLLPGGSLRSDVGELASGPKFKGLLELAEKLFDYVIIDAPPLSLFADAAVMANQADAALLVVRSNSVNYADIERVLDLVPKEKLLGAVLNASDEALASRSYYGDKYYSRSRESADRLSDEH